MDRPSFRNAAPSHVSGTCRSGSAVCSKAHGHSVPSTAHRGTAGSRHTVAVTAPQQQQVQGHVHSVAASPAASGRESRFGRRMVPSLQRPARSVPKQEVIPLLSLSSLAPELQQLIQQRQQQPHVTQSSLLPHPLCELDAAALTKRIKHCSSWRDAAVLFAQQAPCLNHINLSALLVRLAHLPVPPSSRPANWQPFVRQVLATSQPLLQFAEPRQLANMAWALAKLGLHEWCGEDAAALASSSPGDSSSSIYGTQASVSSSSSSSESSRSSSTGSDNSSVLWGAAWQQQVLHTLHAASCCDVSNILWALATSGAHRHPNCSSTAPLPGQPSRQGQRQQQQQSGQVHSRLLQELLSALHRTLPDSRPQDVANAVWALATLQARPSTELLSYLLIRVQAHFGSLKPCEVACTLWALSELHAAPPSSWLRECLTRQVGRQQWQPTEPRHYVMALMACARLKQVPPTAWLVECLQQLQQHMLMMPPPAQTQQQQHHHHHQQQQQQTLSQQQPSLSVRQQGSADDRCQQPTTCTGVAAAAAVGHGGRVGAAVGAAAAAAAADHGRVGGAAGAMSYRCRDTADSSGGGAHRAFAESSGTSSSSSSGTSSSSSSSRPPVHQLSSQDMSNIIWALATLRVRPNGDWMAQFLSASAASLAGASSPQELVNSMWGQQVLRVHPTEAWLAAFDAASMAAMPHFTPQGLADVLAAQVRLGLKPSWAWCEAWTTAVKASWALADASAVCKTLWAAAKCQVPLGRGWLSQALQEVHEPLLLPALASQALSAEELLRLVWAVGRLCRGNLSQELSNLLGLYCCKAAGKMTGVQLTRGAWGLARLVPLPREGLLSYFHDLAASKVKSLPEAEGAELEHKLRLLRDAAVKQEYLGRNWRLLLEQMQQPPAPAPPQQTLDEAAAGLQVGGSSPEQRLGDDRVLSEVERAFAQATRLL